MKVNIETLEKITLILLSKLKEDNGKTIELNDDFYWDIPDNEIYNPYKEPKNLTLGQLSSDIERIEEAISSDSFINYDIKIISSILRALSKIVW
ncbi:hypothetical protein [Riemerella anatipestifer]|uniref:Uncharacterized protein n=1 Tax=Riemerella anatipestifer TaxID=34085 RepID=A0AAP6LKV4_RIEAN|nr:hypothetical protein [Riemerella anatipestifer]MBT0549342.1 hypothetical protein [Riemerella anatipestifer]MBT0555903.1 hypothetical protein [Riemerella anatipestifer]MBT0560105.1 hypothetical protein [Riemerella anatipestifer]MCO7355066.1 hypothetical protein [Riemerella anatipestifer]MCU7540756.1 hypothetical protein [Riemerella anatipestifer]